MAVLFILINGKLAWVFDPYFSFPVTFHGKDIVAYVQSTAHKQKHFFLVNYLTTVIFSNHRYAFFVRAVKDL